MNIGIVGGGSIGLLYGAYLAKNHSVTIYTKTARQANEVSLNGVILENGGMANNIKLQSIPISKGLLSHNVLILAVKEYALVDIIGLLQDHTSQTTLIFLQNGMGHLKYLDQLNFKNIVIGIVEHGAIKRSANQVEHTGIGVTKFSAFRGTKEYVSELAQNLATENFAILEEDDWFITMSSKLIINAVINPLTSIYRVANGELIKNTYFLNVMRQLFEEVTSVILVENQAELWDYLIKVCKSTARNRSSMLRDIEAGRKTEVDAILGYVIEQAESHNKSLAVTSFIYNSIRGIEERGK